MNQTYKRIFAAIIAIIGWTALASEYRIAITSNPDIAVTDATVIYFSFFTIWTNWMVALYMTYQALKKPSHSSWIDSSGKLTAMTGYIFVVGLVYNLILRQLFHAHDAALIDNEAFHTLVPLLVLVFWYFYEHDDNVKYANIATWLAYPFIYAGYTLIHGHFSGFYPYPFVNASKLGMHTVLINMSVLFIAFVVILALLIWVKKRLTKNTL